MRRRSVSVLTAVGVILCAATFLPAQGNDGTGAADLLGVSNDVGTIETYKIADLVAVDGDPLTDINVLTRPVFIMHEGRIVVGD